MASFGLLNSVIWLVFTCILSVKFGEIFVLQLYSIGPIPCCKCIVCLSKQAQLLLFTITYCNKYLILTGTLLFFDNIKPGSLYRGLFDPNLALTTLGKKSGLGPRSASMLGPDCLVVWGGYRSILSPMMAHRLSTAALIKFKCVWYSPDFRICLDFWNPKVWAKLNLTSISGPLFNHEY